MDIKLKSNKINPIFKTIIFLLTLVFAFLAGTSSLQLIRQAIYFNYETENFKNTPAFIVNAEDKIIELSNNAGMVSFYGQNMTYEDFCNNEISSEYLKSEYNENLEKAYNYFDEIQAIKKLEPKIDGTSYDADYDIFYDKNNNEYGTIEDFKIYGEGISSTADNNEYTAPSPANRSPSETFETTMFYNDSEIIPETEENKAYTDALIYETHAEWEYDYAVLRRNLFSIVTDARSKETIKTELQNELNEQLNEAYEDEKWRLYALREKYSNIDFYIQDNTSGNYISNFEKDSDIKNLKENYKTNALFYFHYDGRNIKTTPTNINLKESFLIFALEELGIISEKIDTEMLAEVFGDTTVFVKINNPEIATDAFFTLKQSFDENKFLIPVELKTQTILFGILTLSGIVALAILSKPKYKDGVLKLPFNKRILFFIHLLFFIALVVLIISGIGLSVYEDYTSNLLNFTQEFVFLLNNDSITIIVGILFALLVLTIINFVNYIVVNKKADTLKNRFICWKIHSKFKSLIEKNKNLKQSIQQIEKKLILIVSLWLGIELLIFIAIFLMLLADMVLGALIFTAIFIAVSIVGIIYTFKFLGNVKSLAIATEQMKNGIYNNYLIPEKFIYPLKDFARNLNECQNSIENAIKEALKGERLKTELITNVSHDLKTPLTSIINYVSLLKLSEIQGEDENKYLNILDEKSKKLQRLIEDLTEASKATSGNIKMMFDTVNLNELALQAVGENNDVVENAGLELIVTQKENELFVIADNQHTFRIFDNLFSNVKKYALTGTRVYVDVYKENNYGVFAIKNISKDKLNINSDEITERFVRGDNSRSTEGSGLGLSIAQSFTELQNGIFSIDIDGDLFKVTVKLPIAKTPEVFKEKLSNTTEQVN